MGKSIKQEKALTIVDLVVSKLHTIPKSSYTVKDSDRNKEVETGLKASLGKVQERLSKASLKEIGSDFPRRS